MKELNPWVLKETRYPIVDLKFDKWEDTETKTKLYQKIEIKGNLETGEHPKQVRIRIDLEMESENKKIFAHIIQEEVYETEDEPGWRNRKDAVETVREAVIPNAYQNLKTYVRTLTKKAWSKPIVLKPYEELTETLKPKDKE